MGEIFYFSGTGNSLMLAKDISKKLRFKLSPISFYEDKISIETESLIGFIFPIYNQTYPYILKRFINKIENIKDKSIFCVATYGDSLETSLKKLDNDLQKLGGEIYLGVGINMPYNYLLPSFKLRDFFNNFKLKEYSTEEITSYIDIWNNKKYEIFEKIKNEKLDYIESKNDFLNTIKEKLNLTDTIQKNTWLKIGGYNGKSKIPMQEAVNLMDYSFHFDKNCNGCGICKNICPVDNIDLFDSHPLWKHHCEQCFACLQWCPKNSIQFGENTKGYKRYKNPTISINEMVEGVFYEYEK